MSTGTANFYKLKGSLSAGEYPLLASSPDLSTYRLNQASVKYAAGLQTSITVPIFTNYQDVNVIEIDGSFYWATAWQESTTFNGSVTYLCDYMAPTSLLRSGASISAYLDRSPTYITKYLSDDWTKGEIVFNETNAVDVGYDASTTDTPPWVMYWYQITGVDSSGDFRRFGGFAIVSGGELGDLNIYTAANAPGGKFYPPIWAILNDVEEYVPIAGADVKDISISRRCPYPFSIVNDEIALLSIGGNRISPQQYGTSTMLLYDIDHALMLENLYARDAKTITMTSTDAVKMSGNYIVRDWNKNIIATFPVSEGSTFKTRTYSDISGIYTVITNGHRTMTIPEGKLPWTSSSWEEYRAYQLAGDRQAMINAIGYADRERYNTAIGGLAEGVVSGAISGALVGGPVGAGVGVLTGGVSSIGSMIGADLNYDITVGKLRDEQALRELRAKSGPGTAYNIPYGLLYLSLTMSSKNLAISYASPVNDSTGTLLQAYVDRVGYPCEGLQTITVVEGFYKGYIPTDSNGQGMFKNELNRVMRQGFKFINIG